MRLRAVLDALGSRRFALAVMLAWTALLLVWVVPFEFYGLPEARIRAIVQGEPFFQAVYAVLAVCTLVCIAVRWPGVVSRVRRLPSADRRPHAGEGLEADGRFDAERAEAALTSAGYRRTVSGDGWAWGVRRRYAPLGTLVLHLAITASIVALAVATVPSLRFAGNLVLAEGETFSGDMGAYIDKPDDATGAAPALAFKVERLSPRFYEDILLFTQLDATVRSGDALHSIALSRPWAPRADTLVSLSDFGYALDVIVGSSESTAQVREVRKLKAFPAGQEDSFEAGMGDVRYRVYVKVYGDYVDKSGTPAVRSFNADNPYLLVSIGRTLAASGERMLVEDRLIRVGDTVPLPGGSLTFARLRHYGVFRVVRDPSMLLVAATLLCLAVGSVMRLAFPRVEALVVESDGALRFEVRSDVYGRVQRDESALAERYGGS